jgi:hypothetical protein
MRKTLAALLLLFVLSPLAYAGDTGMPGYEDPPPCDPVTGTCQAVNAAPAPEDEPDETDILTTLLTLVIGATLP